MRIGIRPINDFAFKKIFGSDTNKLSLISFLNAVLCLGVPIVDVVIVNPYNLQDFLDDKLSILDIKATDANGAIYDIEMQVTIFEGLAVLVLACSRIRTGNTAETVSGGSDAIGNTNDHENSRDNRG